MVEETKIPVGYKQTEAGVIPLDWDIPTMNNIAKVIDSLHRTPKFSNDGFPMVRVSDIKLGNLNLSNTLKVDEDVYLQFIKPYKPQKGDIVLSRVGSYGIPSFVFTNEPFCMGQNTVIITTDKNKRFLYHVLGSKGIKEQIENGSYGSGYKSLSLKNIKELKIPLPPTRTEQTAIATALSDMDSLIEGLEKLIAKKRNIKQGAMQELLKPKEGWEVKTLGEIAHFFKGKGLPKSSLNIDDDIKCIHYGELFLKYGEIIKNIEYRTKIFDGAFFSKSNDVLMPTSDVTPYGLATASCVNEDGILLGGDILVIRFDINNINGNYFSFYIKINKNKVMKIVKGVTVYHLYASDMKDFEFEYPSNKEQTRIAQILSDMDSEIEKLETQLSKYKMLKTGMMQELLTGKKRLNHDFKGL